MRIRLRVREVAEAREVNMTKLSHLTFMSFNTIRSMWRHPERTINTDTLARVATALQCHVCDLIEEVHDNVDE